MGETHGFRMGCNELFHLFEWVHRTAGWVVKFSNGKHERSHGSLTHSNGFIERLNGLSSFLNGKHEQANSSLTRSNGFIERLNALLSFLNDERTSDRLTQPFERVYRKTEQVIKFFEQLTQKGKWLTNQFERLIKISKRVPQMTERLTQTIISQNSRTSQEAVLFLLEQNFYCIVSTITTVCEHASLFGTVIFPKTTSGKPLNSVKSFLKARCIALT